jgi:hypothetical protein
LGDQTYRRQEKEKECKAAMKKIEEYTRKSPWGCRSKAGKGTKVK